MACPSNPNFTICAGALNRLGIWVRLHYIYPYPHVDAVVKLMSEDKLLPYLDIPFQHASPNVLKAMKRPAHSENVLARIKTWRSIAPILSFVPPLLWVSLARQKKILNICSTGSRGAIRQSRGVCLFRNRRRGGKRFADPVLKLSNNNAMND